MHVELGMLDRSLWLNSFVAFGLPGFSSKPWFPGAGGCFWAKPRELGIGCLSVGGGNDACFAKSSSNPSVFQVKYFTFNKLPFSNKNLAQCSVSSQLKSQVKTNVWSSIWCQFVLITWSSISKEQTYVFARLSGGSSPECYCQDIKFICEAMETKLFNTPVIIMLSSIIPFLSWVLC